MIVKQGMLSSLAAGLLAVSLLHPATTLASVVIGGTRVIYPAQAREATVKLTNEGKAPALTQAWIDTGDRKAAPSAITAPFLVTPPVSRIDPGKAQTLRIFFVGEALAKDKESIFYLNVLEIPPKPDAEEEPSNRLQLAFRSRIKLFYRPEGLPGSAEEAPAKIRWRLTHTGGGQAALEAINPTPYYVSFTALRIASGANKSLAANEDGGMVAPGETTQFPLKGAVTAGSPLQVRYQAINDYGGGIAGSAELQP